MDLKQEVAAQKVGNGMTAGGSATAIGVWVADNHELIWFIFGVIGVLVAVVGVCIQLIFQLKRNKREVELHVLKLEEMEARLKRE